MHINFIITYNCNLKCKHCIFDSPKVVSLDINVFKKIIKMFVPYGLKSVGFTGGEAITHPNFSEMVDFISDYNLSFAFVTNAQAYEKYLPIIQKQREFLSHIKISVDGLEKENDSIRGKGTFKKVIQAIYFYKLLGIKIYLHFVLTNINKDLVEEYIKYFSKFNLDSIQIGSILPTPYNKELMISENDKKKVFLKIIKLKKDYPNIKTTSSFYIKNDVHFCGVIDSIRFDVDPYGNFTFCCNLPSNFGIFANFNDKANIILKKRINISKKLLNLMKKKINKLKPNEKSCIFCYNYFNKINKI